MEQVTVAPPPLPPKTRRAPPDAPTVLSTSNNLNYNTINRYPDVDTTTTKSHVVKIHINPDNSSSSTASVICGVVTPCIRISVNNNNNNNNNEMVQNPTTTMVEERSNYFFYNCMSSGQVSPSDTLDSGTCSDLDGTPPPLPKKKTSGISVTLIGGGGGDGVVQHHHHHNRASSLTSSGAEIDSDDNDSNVSCDSLNSGKISPIINNNNKTTILPQTLLQDIRQRNAKLTSPETMVIKSYEERKEEKLNKEQKENNKNCYFYETDMFYNFHLNEHISVQENIETTNKSSVVQDETFAGYKDLLGDGASTIRSAKGTVRGVKNRVRAGIATFLQINSNIKTYKEKDAGKVVVYTTTMGILRETYQACMKVKQILRTLLVKFEERDVFMSNDYQMEIRDRMRCDQVLVPQVFVDGQHIGDAETVERLNESGELRRILKPYKSMDACTTCRVCGGYRLLPCQVCNGSKKSVHRNHFTTEFVALKCMNCDEVGLVRCNAC